MTRVAGTRIFEAHDDARSRALLVSDLHVSRHGHVVVERFAALCREARRLPDCTRLVVLGDLFEFYINRRQLRVDAWASLVATLRDTVAAGVPVTVLHGNRDFLLGADFERASGARVVAGGLRVRFGSSTTLLMHGDEFCQNDVTYQRAKPKLRSAPVRLLAHNLPLWMLLRAGATARGASRERALVESPRYAPVGSAVAEAFASGADRLVFGHIHRPARGRFGGGVAEYAILPAFDETGVYLEATGSELRYRKLVSTSHEPSHVRPDPPMGALPPDAPPPEIESPPPREFA